MFVYGPLTVCQARLLISPPLTYLSCSIYGARNQPDQDGQSPLCPSMRNMSCTKQLYRKLDYHLFVFVHDAVHSNKINSYISQPRFGSVSINLNQHRCRLSFLCIKFPPTFLNIHTNYADIYGAVFPDSYAPAVLKHYGNVFRVLFKNYERYTLNRTDMNNFSSLYFPHVQESTWDITPHRD